METREKPTAWWFAVGLVTTVIVCLCLAVGVLGVSSIGTVIGRMLSQEVGTLSSQTQDAEAPGEVADPSTPEMLSDEPGTEMDLAAESLKLISDTVVPINDPISLAQRLKGLEEVPKLLAESAQPLSVGTVETFWVLDSVEMHNFQISAELVYISDHVYFWVETEVEYELEDVANLVEDFEENIYPTNRAFFGSEWTPGVDGDPHLYILYTRGLGAAIAGQFGPNDEYSPLVHQYSNGHEMFYLNADNQYLWADYTRGVLAHEFQHMIHWSRDSNESSWLNEGFSELAVLLNGYDIGGFDYVFASDPDQTLDFWPGPGDTAPHYGQAFLFVTYFFDRFGAEATQSAVANPANGLTSIDQTLKSLGILDLQSGEPITVDTVYADWGVALWVQDITVDDGQFGFKSYDPPRPAISDQFHECPFEEQTRQVGQYGLDYIQFYCQGQHTLTFDGMDIVRVVPADPHSGSYAYWSQRGDTSDMRLTRAFDFRDVTGEVSFSYWVWYDIEEDWDYVYLEASIDGGESWQILTTPSGTDTNPTGNSYGWGYTGYSGGRSSPIWIQETVDLSEFAGKEVLLRFEYVTDAAVNGEGLLLDDLVIEAIGYQEDFESEDDGWEAEGFVRLFNRLPQTYRVLLVETGAETRVREMPLDEKRHAEIDLNLGGEYDEAVLMVIGTTRHTWQPAIYRFQTVP
ncbi:MAG: hypothetical protein GTO14_09515 [Anaerolineales bacterium]|nr:hypothetical protein [Anaerolineales bacterium]